MIQHKLVNSDPKLISNKRLINIELDRIVRILFKFSNTSSPLLPEEAVFDRGEHLNRVQSSQFYPLISFYIPRRKASVIAVNQITVPSLTSAGFLK